MRARSVVWIAAGAAGAYMFDPKAGRGRRAATRARARAGVRHAERRAAQTLRHRWHDATGAAKRAVASRRRDRDYDDATLQAKVRSEAFRHSSIPKGSVLLDVSDGVVTLRGRVPSQQMVADAGRLVGDVAGVRGVANHLHANGSESDASNGDVEITRRTRATVLGVRRR